MGTVADMNILAKKGNILYQLSEIEIEQLRTILTEMLIDIESVCKKYNLCYMLGYGSCLGSVRHKGFIPWDDDLDLLMPREDLKKFLNIFEKELGNKYVYTAPNTCKETKNNFTKIYRKDTLFMEITDVNSKFPRGIYVDITPLDYVPDNAFLRALKAYCCNFLCKIAVSVFYANNSNKQLIKFMKQNKKMYIVFRVRQFLGKIASIIPHGIWANWADKLMQGKPSKLMTDYTGSCYNKVYPVKIFLPTKKGFFNNNLVNLPNMPDLYCKITYGEDYMQLPPESKRRRHFILNFQPYYKEKISNFK